MPLDLWCETEHTPDIARPGEGDGPLVGGFAGLEENLPLNGLTEKHDCAGRPGLPGRFGLAPARREV